MQICEVVGNIWATRKKEELEGLKLLVVAPLDFKFKQIDVPAFVAVDTIGAGVGEKVLVTSGSSARVALKRDDISVDAVIVGIIDTLEVEKQMAIDA